MLHKSPCIHFTNIYKGTMPPTQRILRELHAMITEGGADVSSFIDSGGISGLAKVLENLSKAPPTEYDGAEYFF